MFRLKLHWRERRTSSSATACSLWGDLNKFNSGGNIWSISMMAKKTGADPKWLFYYLEGDATLFSQSGSSSPVSVLSPSPAISFHLRSKSFFTFSFPLFTIYLLLWDLIVNARHYFIYNALDHHFALLFDILMIRFLVFVNTLLQLRS